MFHFFHLFYVLGTLCNCSAESCIRLSALLVNVSSLFVWWCILKFSWQLRQRDHLIARKNSKRGKLTPLGCNRLTTRGTEYEADLLHPHWYKYTRRKNSRRVCNSSGERWLTARTHWTRQQHGSVWDEYRLESLQIVNERSFWSSSWEKAPILNLIKRCFIIVVQLMHMYKRLRLNRNLYFTKKDTNEQFIKLDGCIQSFSFAYQIQGSWRLFQQGSRVQTLWANTETENHSHLWAI